MLSAVERGKQFKEVSMSFVKLAKFILPMLAVSAIATAATSTGTITIKGTVTESVSLSVAETSGFDTLNLSGNISDQEIAKLNIVSNAKDGFTLALSTTNNLSFKGTGSAQQTARYTLKYLNIAGTEQTIGKSGDSTDITYTDGSGATLENIGTQSSATNATNRTLKVSYTNANLLYEPEFSDAISLTLTNK